MIIKTQPYLKSPMFSNEETSLLFALRTQTARTFRANFSQLYGGKVECPLKCENQSLHEPAFKDSQEHLLWCERVKLQNPIIAQGKAEYSDIFAHVNRQKEVITMYLMIIEEREKIMKSENNQPGGNLDPSNGSSCCCNSTLFTSLTCIDCTLTGK